MIEYNKTVSNRLSKAMAALERRHRIFMNHALEADGVEGVLYKYIITIKNHPGANQDFLADFHGVDKSRVARIVRDLELNGYISRSLSPENRRQYRLELTSSGEGLYELIMKKTQDWEMLITRSIAEEDIALTIGTIDKIIKNLDMEK